MKNIIKTNLIANLKRILAPHATYRKKNHSTLAILDESGK